MVRMNRWQFDLPDYFVARYFGELVKWAEERPFKPIKPIVLLEGYYSDPSPNEEQGPEFKGVLLFAKCGRRLVEAEPYREQDRAKIVKHCRKMMDHGIPPGAVLIEPPRPWVPFMPNLTEGE